MSNAVADKVLTWEDRGGYLWAELGEPGLGVTFSLQNLPTCYRRGPWKLHVVVEAGPMHESWGCLDYQDVPTRWYHSKDNAMDEAERIARVLLDDFRKATQAMR